MHLSTPITHGACGKSWTGGLRAHCPVCHRTFNRDSGAEAHRTGTYSGGRTCSDPAALGYTERDGVWYAPAPANAPWGNRRQP